MDQLLQEGLDMFRVNMAHGGRDQNRCLIEEARESADRVGKLVPVLVDLQGPKIRVGRLRRPLLLSEGQEITFAPEGQHEANELPTTYPDLAADVRVGGAILLDDGMLELECLTRAGDRATFRVVRGGLLHSNKGINLPGTEVGAPSLTEKDLEDLELALEQGVEYVGLSFVRRGADVATLKEKVGRRALVVAKIEMAQALNQIEEILAEADAVMVARGDLGVELPFEKVPLAQKRIIRLASYFGRPVITATQMLESMIDQPLPTRAEASDVANAILDGTDAVMLSGETAIGRYPIQSVEAIVRITREIEEESGVLESGPRYLLRPDDRLRAGASPREHSVASATVQSARQLGAPAIIVLTLTGFSVRLVSSYRPPVPIFGICTDPKTARQLSAVWGVRPVLAEGAEVSYASLVRRGKEAVLDSGLGEEGDSVVITSGFPFHISGTTNTMRVERLERSGP
jgi:pyruvate kinase